MKKAVVFGASGDLGSAFEFELGNKGFDVSPFGRSEILRESSTPIKALGSSTQKNSTMYMFFAWENLQSNLSLNFQKKKLKKNLRQTQFYLLS